MSSVIRDLAVKLSLQADTFNNGIKAAQREAQAFEKNWKPSLTLAKDMGLAVGAAGTAVAGGMLVASKAAVDYGDAINDARQQTGIAVEQLARYGFAAEQNGSSVGGLGVALKGLANNMQAAAAGGKSQIAAFAAAGISTSQLAAANGDMEKVMLLVADRFAAMEDGAAKSALAVDIFGKAGVSMIPMLNEGSAGLKKLGDQAQAAGLVISKETAAACDELNDQLNLMKASALGASVEVAKALLPTLQDAAKFAIEGTQAFAGFIKEHQELTKAAFIGATAIGGIGSAIAGAGLFIPPFVKGLGYAKAALVELSDFMALGGGAVGSAVTFTAAMVTLGYELSNLHDAWKANIVAQGDAEVATAQQQESTIRAAKALKDGLGVEVPKGTKSWKEWGEAIATAAHAAAKFTVVGGAAAEKVKTAGQMIAEQSQKMLDQAVHYRTFEEHMQVINDLQEKQKEKAAALREEQEKAAAAAKAQADEQSRLNAQFAASLRPADELFKGINKLVAAGFDHKDILAKYKDEIINTVTEQKLLGKSVDANTEAWYREAVGLKAVSAAALAAAQNKAAAAAITAERDKAAADMNAAYTNKVTGGYDPFGGKDPFAAAIVSGAAQPAIPGNVNIGPSPNTGRSIAGGDAWAGGWINGVFYPPAGSNLSPTSMAGFQQEHAGAGTLLPGAQMTSNFNVTIPIAITTSAAIDARIVRSQIIPEITSALKTGAAREDWTRVFKETVNGLASTKGR